MFKEPENLRILQKLFTEGNEGNEEKATQGITYLRCLCLLYFKNLFATAHPPWVTNVAMFTQELLKGKCGTLECEEL